MSGVLLHINTHVGFLSLDVLYSLRVASLVSTIQFPVLSSRKCGGASQADYTCSHMWTRFSLNESFRSRTKQLTREIQEKKVLLIC